MGIHNFISRHHSWPPSVSGGRSTSVSDGAATDLARRRWRGAAGHWKERKVQLGRHRTEDASGQGVGGLDVQEGREGLSRSYVASFLRSTQIHKLSGLRLPLVRIAVEF